jgi:6-phosphogluconolactonase
MTRVENTWMSDYVDELDYGERGRVAIVADARALAEAAAETLIAAVAEAIAERGRAVVSLAGGSTPQRMGELLATDEYRGRIDWSRLHVFWGDERWVPLEHPECNAGEAIRTFLDDVDIPAPQVHPYHTHLEPPRAAARQYEEQLREVFGAEALPRFDLIFLGVGDDGHTASLFPGADAINEKHDWVVAYEVPKLSAIRLSLTPPVLNAARRVAFVVGGGGKAHVLHTILDGGLDVDETPAQVVRPANGELVWLVDVAAAELLERRAVKEA